MSPRTHPPGPSFASETKRGWRTLAEELSGGILTHVRSNFDRFGDVYFIKNVGTPTYVTRDPDHVYEVLITRAASFRKRKKDVQAILGEGLLTSDGELWRRQRRMIQPAFQRQNLARYAAVMAEHTARRLEGWKPGERKDLGREMMELTLSVVCKALLDHDAVNHNDGVARAMTILQDTAGQPDFLPQWLPTPLHRKRRRASAELDAIILPMIDARTRERPAEDLIWQLRFGTEGEEMPRQQLRDELVTLFLAGHETTALALTWSFFLLARNRTVETKLHEELERVLGGRAPQFEDVESLPFTRWVIQEAMRIFPPLYLLPRVAAEDTEVGGYSVAAGSEVLLWIYFLHHNPRWFPRPAEFRPDRFAPGSPEILHPHAYYPFGAGPRACIGRHFAMIEAQLILAAIAQRFRLRLAPDLDVRIMPRVTLGPSVPIVVDLHERTR